MIQYYNVIILIAALIILVKKDFLKRYLFIPDYVVKDDILIQTNDTDNYFNKLQKKSFY